MPPRATARSGMTTDGGFATYALHHASSLYRLPDNVSDEDAVMITTAGTGLYGLDATGGFIAGQDVAVFGPGPVGLMTVQACHQLGGEQRDARRHPREPARGRAPLRRRPPRQRARARPGRGDHGDHRRARRRPRRRVLRCASVAPQQCVEAIKRGGKLLVVAFYPGPVELDMSHVVRSDITIYTTRGEGGNNVKRAVSLAVPRPAVGRRARHAPLRPRRHRGGLPGRARTRSSDPLKVVLVP